MPATEVTPSLKRDLTLLQMRDVLDPKRHYRASAKKLPKYFQVVSVSKMFIEFRWVPLLNPQQSISAPG
jgi:Fcf2 pre-rRNA processing